MSIGIWTPPLSEGEGCHNSKASMQTSGCDVEELSRETAWALNRETRSCIMVGKPKLHYINGRGRVESIEWPLATAGVEFEEKFTETPEDLGKLKNDGSLMFQQAPMVKIDGMRLVQIRAILNDVATKYNLCGRDMKERPWLTCMQKVWQS